MPFTIPYLASFEAIYRDSGKWQAKSNDIARIAEVSFVSSLGYSCIVDASWDLCGCQDEFGYMLGPCCS